MNIEIYPKRIYTILLYIILFLLFANVTGIVSRFYFGHGYIHGLIPLFNFDRENNIPTLYSAFALFFACILLSIIASAHKRRGSSHLAWTGLAIIFLFLSIDEVASIHERFSEPVRELLKTSGLLYSAWVIPYGIAFVILGMTYLKFLMHLPLKIRLLFVISGVTFIGGAVGFEAIGVRYAYYYGLDNVIYAIFYTSEEFLEMLGIAIFIYGLLLYITIHFKQLTIRVGGNKLEQSFFNNTPSIADYEIFCHSYHAESVIARVHESFK